MRVLLEKVTNFNSHAHVERDDRFNAIETAAGNFNSHAHVERDPKPLSY